MFLDDVHRLLAESDQARAVDILTDRHKKADGRRLTHVPVVVATCSVAVVDNVGQHMKGLTREVGDLLQGRAVRVPVAFDPSDEAELDRAGVLADRPYVIQRLVGPADLKALVDAAEADSDQTRWAALRALAIAGAIGGVPFDRLAALAGDIFRQRTGRDLDKGRLEDEVWKLQAPADILDLPAVAADTRQDAGSGSVARWHLSRVAEGLVVPVSDDGRMLDLAERHRLAEWLLADGTWDPVRELWRSAEKVESALGVVIPGFDFAPFGVARSVADNVDLEPKFQAAVRALRVDGPRTVTQTAVLAAALARAATDAYSHDQALLRLASEARDRPVAWAAVAALHLDRAKEVQVETVDPDGEPVSWTETWPDPAFPGARAAYLRGLDAGEFGLWRLLGDLELLAASDPREGTFDGPVPAAAIHAYAAAAATGDAAAAVRLAACICGGPWDEVGEMSRGEWWPSGFRDIAEVNLAAAAQLIRRTVAEPESLENAEDLPPWLPWVMLALIEHLRGRVDVVEDAARRALALGLPARYVPVDHKVRWSPTRCPDDVGEPARELLDRLSASASRSLRESLANLLPDPQRHLELLSIAQEFRDADAVRAHLQRAAQQGHHGAVVHEARRLWRGDARARRTAKELVWKTIEAISSPQGPEANLLGPEWAAQVAGWLYLSEGEEDRSLGEWLLRDLMREDRLEAVVRAVVSDQANIDSAHIASVWPPPATRGLLEGLTGIDEGFALALEIWVIDHRLQQLSSRGDDPSHARAAERITALRARIDQVDRAPDQTARRLTDLIYCRSGSGTWLAD